MALATPEELASYLQRELLPSEAVSAQLVLDLASALIEAHAGRRLTRTATPEIATLTAYGGLVFLPSPPVEVTEVTVNGTVVAAADYEVRPDEGVILIGVADGTRVKVTFHSGPESIPEVAKALVLSLAVRLMTNADGVTQKSIGDVSISYGRAQSGPGLTEWEMQAAASLRVVGVS